MRVFFVAALVIVLFASAASAQISWSQSADIGRLTLKQMYIDGDTILETEPRLAKFGVVADFGDGFVAEGIYGKGTAGELISGGSVRPDSHNVSMVRFNARYTLYERANLSMGPLWSYQFTYWNFKLGGPGRYSFNTIGMGMGAFASVNLGPGDFFVSYLKRPIVKLSLSFPDSSWGEAVGSGDLVSVAASYSMSDVTKVIATYEIDTQYSDDIYQQDGIKQVLSGINIGLRFSF